MDVVAERFHHQVQYLFVLAEHDVRASGVEGESVLDDRSAQAADAVPPLDDFDVIAEERGERDSGDAAAENADGTMSHEGGVLYSAAARAARRDRVATAGELDERAE